MTFPKFQVKAGRFFINQQTKKVKPIKNKGKIIVERTEDEQTHFRWIDLQTNTEQFDLIVFAMDAKFQPVQGKNNTYVLKFDTDTDKHYFWMQEKIQSEYVVKKINAVISYQEREKQEKSAFQLKPSITDKMVPENVEQPAATTQKPLFDQDFISRITRNLQAAQKQNNQASITHLEKIFNHETISKILNELVSEQKAQMVEFLPEQQQKLQYFDRNVRSAQFGQALDALSDALNSQTAIAIFAEMGLNQSNLKKYYGVHAFLKALVEWGKSQKKQ